MWRERIRGRETSIVLALLAGAIAALTPPEPLAFPRLAVGASLACAVAAVAFLARPRGAVVGVVLLGLTLAAAPPADEPAWTLAWVALALVGLDRAEPGARGVAARVLVSGFATAIVIGADAFFGTVVDSRSSTIHLALASFVVLCGLAIALVRHGSLGGAGGGDASGEGEATGALDSGVEEQ